jgi:hypothetical protein
MKKYFIILFLLSACASYGQIPRIDSMYVDEAKSELQIYGEFGSLQGQVRVDTVEMSIQSWTDSILVAAIPRKGRGSAGPVVVGSRGYQSDKRMLSLWVYSSSQDRSESHIDGISREHFDFGLSARADIHSRLRNSEFNSIDFQGIHYCTIDENSSLESTHYGNSSSSSFDTVPFGVHLDPVLRTIIFDVSYTAEIGTDFNRDPFAPDLDSTLNIISGMADGSFGGGIFEVAHWNGNCLFAPPDKALSLLNRPTLFLPLTGTMFSLKNDVILSWDSLPSMNSYRIEVGLDTVFKKDTIDRTTTLQQLSIPPLTGLNKYYWRVAGINAEGQSQWSDIWNFATGRTADIISQSNDLLSLKSFPNPSSKELNISYSLPDRENTRIILYDLEGRVMRENNAATDAGRHQLKWDVSQLPSGSYVLGLITDQETRSQVITIIH